MARQSYVITGKNDTPSELCKRLVGDGHKWPLIVPENPGMKVLQTPTPEDQVATVGPVTFIVFPWKVGQSVILPDGWPTIDQDGHLRLPEQTIHANPPGSSGAVAGAFLAVGLLALGAACIAHK